jgi:hypothetical protein
VATLDLVLRLRVLLPTLAAALALSVGSGTASASSAQSSLPGTPVPQGFVGMDLDGPPLVAANNIDLSHQFDLMVSNGVQNVRVVFSWAAAQPTKGAPFDFSQTDQVVQMAAARHVTVLPTVLYAPSWDEGKNRHGVYGPPAKTGPFAAYLTALIKRYGPHGTFWNNHSPREPIRMWQIWNEPNLSYYWPQPFAKSYVKLLKAAHRAIRRADPGAKAVLGALTNTAWESLGQVDKVSGAMSAYDVIAVNGFTSTPARVIKYLQFVRRAADSKRNHKPLLATELSWPSAKGKSPQHFDWSTTEKGQAKDITALLPMLAQHRAALKLIGFDYYTWMGEETPHAPAFDFAGLLRFTPDGTITEKPGLNAFHRSALALEHCRQKGTKATVCIR